MPSPVVAFLCCEAVISSASLSSIAGESNRRQPLSSPHKAMVEASDATAIVVDVTAKQIEMMKVLLRDPLGDIRLEDLLRDMTGPVARELNDFRFPASAEDLTMTGFAPVWIAQVHDYESVLAPLLEPTRLIGSYGLASHAQVWKRFMAPVARWADGREGLPALLELRAYPALLLVHTAAIAAVLRENYGTLLGLGLLPRIRSKPGYGGSRSESLLARVDARSVVADSIDPIASALAKTDEGVQVTAELVERLMQGGRPHTPMSNHLSTLLRPVFEVDIDRDDEWDDAFETAEVILDALATDAEAQQEPRSFRTPGGFGRYTWRHKHSDSPPEARLLKELQREGDGWGPIAAGLFGGRSSRAADALSSVATTAEAIRSSQW